MWRAEVHRSRSVKNAMGPDTIDEQALRRLADCAFSGYETSPIPAPIELARELVLGAADYAHQLGFTPHPDFEQMIEHDRRAAVLEGPGRHL